jgi:adenylate kinase
MKRGDLVPDSLVCEIVENRLQEPDASGGFILDGFPRTLSQAIWLDNRLAELGFGNTVIAVSIRMGHERLLQRIAGRWNCPFCQGVYNIYFNPPKRAGLCDLDGTALIQRADDVEAVFEERLRTYDAMTAPVVEHYRSLGRFVVANGDGSIQDIAAQIAGAVDQLRT